MVILRSLQATKNLELNDIGKLPTVIHEEPFLNCHSEGLGPKNPALRGSSLVIGLSQGQILHWRSE